MFTLQMLQNQQLNDKNITILMFIYSIIFENRFRDKRDKELSLKLWNESLGELQYYKER